MDTAAIPATMTAWLRTDYGPAAGTTLQSVDVPRPGKGEVLLKVRATALAAGDVRLLLGDPRLARLAFGLRRPSQPIRGIDVAGTVVAVGADVPQERIGDEVVVELSAGGGLAAFVVASAARLVARPDDVEPGTAATLSVSAGTAQQALDLAGIEAGNRVLVLGGSGGVGTFTVQLAVERGAEVDATCSEPNRALVERIGATRTFDHRVSPASALHAGTYDAIIDIVGNEPLLSLRNLLTPKGTLVMVSGAGGSVLGPLPRMLRAALLSIGSGRRIRPLMAMPKPEMTAALIELAREGMITPVIERTYPFSEASAALARVETGHAVGKVVVRVEE
ncbi:NAD(P)-dependent alcohol dehydrogenase [Microbacterium murale]|uniref:NADPH:quinone reductase-like Zn-dependent oxidoreductase n=1 Tax=Microbacterium murale TaxID=1081040 RepID=A0ABU0P6B9_9MICO|nr:NAD(P)-dependent alcohol dehydrogenase [Microbacterium murale]MDQ0642865.1 NADPH:quinone reductase-like Zn-dependent oxidoreductase [Microbacterium murale]